ncbi:kinase-like domain-containing protein, partial [Catenaria anguillulae PL171]
MDKASDTNTSTRAPRRDKNKDNPNEPPVIGSYKIDRTLGQGTYGKVKLGLHQQTGEKVAIKIIEKANIQSQRQVARIQREIRFLKLLHHPHIVKVYEVHETAEQIFIVMEFVQGGELFDYIVSHKRVKEKEARAFYRMMLSALHYCHANAVIHRDLKPENLLLDNDKTIKIIDFGFGNTFKPHGLLETFCGSPFYAAPEMILGKKYEGPEVDMWSVGVILFALLCGHLPFDDENIKELYKKIAAGSFTCPSYLSPSAKHLIQRLITVDPRKRATLDEVLNHAWVNEGFTRPPHSYLPERPVIRDPAELSPDIVHRLHAFGYTQEDIEKAFLEEDHSKPHPIRATYFLLQEMLTREEKKLRDAKKGSVSGASGGKGAQPLATSPNASTSSSTIASSMTAVNTSSNVTIPNGTPATAAAPPALSAAIPSPPIITTSAAPDREATTDSPTASMVNVAVAPSSPAALGAPVNGAGVTCSLYSISEDEDGHARHHHHPAAGSGTNSAGATMNHQSNTATAGPPPTRGTHAGISASNKGQFTSMPQVTDAKSSRRASTPETPDHHHQHATAVSPVPPVRVPERPRHSTTSLTSSPGPRTAPPAMNTDTHLPSVGPPSPTSPDMPMSAGTSPSRQPLHLPSTANAQAAQTSTAGSAAPGQDGKGRRFSLANLTTGSKRRSSTTPAKPQNGGPSTSPPGTLAAPSAGADGGVSGESTQSGGDGNGAVPPSGSTASGEPGGSADSARTVSSWFLNVNTTSAKPPLEIIAEVKRVLAENRVDFGHDGGFIVECRLADLVFEIEICKVPRLSLFGLHFKRISGGIWAYKKLCNKLLSQMNL